MRTEINLPSRARNRGGIRCNPQCQSPGNRAGDDEAIGLARGAAGADTQAGSVFFNELGAFGIQEVVNVKTV